MLTLTNVSAGGVDSAAGDYQCSAVNKHGRIWKNFYLNVLPESGIPAVFILKAIITFGFLPSCNFVRYFCSGDSFFLSIGDCFFHSGVGVERKR